MPLIRIHSSRQAPQASIWFVACALAVCPLACGGDGLLAPTENGHLSVGTWGGDTAGVIVDSALTHVHIGCTFGDVPNRIAIDSDGRFSVSGSYLLRAYPVAIGPTMPAQFTGRLTGSTLVMTVVVNDTINRTVVTRGPISVRLGVTPQLAPCPICSVKSLRARGRRPGLWWRVWQRVARNTA